MTLGASWPTCLTALCSMTSCLAVAMASGIYCDLLHIVDLQLAADAVWSSLLELSNSGHDLPSLWKDYNAWCTSSGPSSTCFTCSVFVCGCWLGRCSKVVVVVAGVPHASRASHRLFTKKILKPSTVAYTHISQKVLKGVATRFVIFWLVPFLHQCALDNPGDVYIACLWSQCLIWFLCVFIVS